jgi:hypothetical protein
MEARASSQGDIGNGKEDAHIGGRKKIDGGREAQKGTIMEDGFTAHLPEVVLTCALCLHNPYGNLRGGGQGLSLGSG